MTTLSGTPIQCPRLVHRLDNGLRVVVEEDHLTPAVAVNLWYGVGSRHEQPGRTGLAHLFEHLMFQGSAHVASGEHFAVLEALGSDLNATTSHDRTNYFETVPTTGLDLALWLEADRFGGLLAALNQANLDNQRDVVRNERRQRYDNQPYGTAWERLFAATFPAGHQYHHMPIGSMADLAAATLDDVREFFSTHYVPANAVLSVVGDVDAADALKRVERYFGGIAAAPPPPVRAPQTLTVQRSGVRMDVDDEDVPLPAAYLMWPVPADGTDDCDAVQLAAYILAGATGSRLAVELTRRRHIAGSVGGGLSRLVGGHSVVSVTAHGVDGVSPSALLDAIHAEVERFVAEPPTAEELEATRAAAEAAYLHATQDLGGRADSLSHGLCLFDDPDHDVSRVEALRTVSAEAVHRAAARWLQPDKATVLTYRPATTPTTTIPLDLELSR